MNIPFFTKLKNKRDERRQEQIRQSWVNGFVVRFQFKPKYLTDPIYQHEAYIKLGFLASALCSEAESYKKHPTSKCLKEDYEKALKEFVEACEYLKHFSPELAKALPHWTNFPGFLEDLLNGEPDKVFTPVTLDTQPAQDLLATPYEAGDWCEASEHLS